MFVFQKIVLGCIHIKKVQNRVEALKTDFKEGVENGKKKNNNHFSPDKLQQRPGAPLLDPDDECVGQPATGPQPLLAQEAVFGGPVQQLQRPCRVQGYHAHHRLRGQGLRGQGGRCGRIVGDEGVYWMLGCVIIKYSKNSSCTQR